jgi:GNAT superfamily N-acetyltransferase
MDYLTIEEISMNAHPALSTVLYDGWVLRFAGGYTKRANCANPIRPSRDEIGRKVDAVEALYRAQSLPTIFKMVAHPDYAALGPPARGAGLRARVGDVGAKPSTSRRSSSPYASVASVSDRFEPAWVTGFLDASRVPEAHRPVARGHALPPRARARRRRHRARREIVACAYGVIERGWLGVFDVVVREPYRGKGLGRAIMAELLAAGRGRGATASYLQVVTGTEKAERLYASLGSRESSEYAYRIG